MFYSINFPYSDENTSKVKYIIALEKGLSRTTLKAQGEVYDA